MLRHSLGLLAAALLSTTAMAQTPQRADLCVELSDYLTKLNTAKPADTAPPAQQATAVQAPAKDESRPQPGGTDSAQQTSGMSGPVAHGGTGAPGPQGQAQESAASAQNNPKSDGKSEAATNRPPQQGQQPAPQGQQQAANAPAAAAPPQAPPPKPEVVQAAQAAIDAKDLLACRDATQKMRRAGVNLPPALMTLGALDPKLLKSSEGGGAQGDAPSATP